MSRQNQLRNSSFWSERIEPSRCVWGSWKVRDNSQIFECQNLEAIVVFRFFAWCCCMLFRCLTVRSITWENFPYTGRLDCHEARDILRMILWSRDGLSTWYCWWKTSIIYGVLYMAGGAGFRPSTVSYGTSWTNAFQRPVFRGLAHFCRWACGILHDPLFTALSVGCPGRQLPSCFQGHAPTIYVSKWDGHLAIQIIQHVQHVPKHVQLHTLNSQVFSAVGKHETNDMAWWLVAFFSVKPRRIENVKYSWKMMRLAYVLPVN